MDKRLNPKLEWKEKIDKEKQKGLLSFECLVVTFFLVGVEHVAMTLK